MLSPLAEKLTWLDYSIVGIYLIVLLVIGYRASRQKNTDETLFLANKSLDWYSIGFNMWGTNVDLPCFWHLLVLVTALVLWQ
jgi:SSS family solute:Na+ symporter